MVVAKLEAVAATVLQQPSLASMPELLLTDAQDWDGQFAEVVDLDLVNLVGLFDLKQKRPSMARQRDVYDNYRSAEELCDVGNRLAETTGRKPAREAEKKHAYVPRGTESDPMQHKHAGIP